MADLTAEIPADLLAVLARHLPDVTADDIVPMGEGGDHVAYEAGDVVLRMDTRQDRRRRAAAVEREAELLRTVAAICPAQVPEPLVVAADHGCLVCRRVPGVPLIDLPSERWAPHVAALAEALGGVVRALHAVPAQQVEGVVGVDDWPTAEWLREAAETYPAVRDAVPASLHPAVEAFLRAEPPADDDRRVFAHNDLGIEHVLVDPDTFALTGIIDWSDAAFTDPARDLGRVLRDLGPEALDVVLRGHPADDPGVRRRALFLARCAAIEDLAFGLASGRDAYAELARAALARLFA